MKLDLPTLKHIKTMFDFHSDTSSRCNGYYSLCKIIEEEEKKLTPNNTGLVCGDCWGSGWETQFVTPCIKCKGTGKVLENC